MSRIGSFKSRILSRELMVGTFLKTPHYVMIEIFAKSGFDFLCLDAEHAHHLTGVRSTNAWRFLVRWIFQFW